MSNLEIVFSLSEDKQDVIEFESIDFILEEASKLETCLTWIVFLLIVVTNSSVISLIVKQASRTFLDNLVILDCCFCLANGFYSLETSYKLAPNYIVFIGTVCFVFTNLVMLHSQAAYADKKILQI